MINLSLELKSLATPASAGVEVVSSLGQVFPFQFMVFIDMPYADWHPGPLMQIDGRTHVNGDFCIGSDTPAQFSNITAAGRLMHLSDTRCLLPMPGSLNASIAVDSTYTKFAQLQLSGDNGCTSCAGTSQAWKAYDLATWNGNALDKANGVSLLKLPGEGTANSSQFGVNGPSFAPASNQQNMRFVLDPPVASDSAQITKQKFSNNADIRIIDGVWYLNDPTLPWPGRPVWSDHPGKAVDMNGSAVGQADIRALAAATNPWSATDTPHAYSFYEYSTSGSSLASDPSGVISYGNLGNRGTSPPSWAPAGWISAAGARCPLLPFPEDQLRSREGPGFPFRHARLRSRRDGGGVLRRHGRPPDRSHDDPERDPRRDREQPHPVLVAGAQPGPAEQCLPGQFQREPVPGRAPEHRSGRAGRLLRSGKIHGARVQRNRVPLGQLARLDERVRLRPAVALSLPGKRA